MNHLPSCPTIENPRSICNCPTTPIEDSWEERFEQQSPLAFSGREWAKNFIRAEIASEKARVVAIVEDEMRKNEDMYGMTPINLTMDCIKEKLK